MFVLTIVLLLIVSQADAQFSWAEKMGGTGISSSSDMITDNFGNTYLVGQFNSPSATFGSITLTGPGNTSSSDVYVAKYNTDGVAQWVKGIQGNGEDTGIGVDLDGQGNVYVTGTYRDSLWVGDSLFTSVQSNTRDVFVAKFDNNGDFIWAQRAYGPLQVEVFDIAVHDNGDFYITGAYNGDPDFGGVPFPSPGNNEVSYLAKYNADGQLVWLDYQYGTAGGGQSSRQSGAEVAIDPNGQQVYMAGWFSGDVTWGGTGGITLSSLGEQANPFLARYDSMGNIQWVKRFGAYQNQFFNSEPIVNDLAVKSTGDVILLAQFGGGIIFNDTDSVETDQSITTGSWHYESFLVSYDSLGSYQWRSMIVGDEAEASDMALDGSDNIYLTGSVDGDIDFGAIQHSQSTGSPFIAKFNSNGMALSSLYGAVYSEAGKMEISVDGNGNTYISGPFFSNASFPPINITSDGTQNTYLAKTGISSGIDGAMPEKAGMLLYPNPASNLINITSNDLLGEVEVVIYNTLGEVKLTKQFTIQAGNAAVSVDASQLQSGIYYVEMTGSGKIATTKLIMVR